jgi:hypothetical protein
MIAAHSVPGASNRLIGTGRHSATAEYHNASGIRWPPLILLLTFAESCQLSKPMVSGLSGGFCWNPPENPSARVTISTEYHWITMVATGRPCQNSLLFSLQRISFFSAYNDGTLHRFNINKSSWQLTWQWKTLPRCVQC